MDNKKINRLMTIDCPISQRGKLNESELWPGVLRLRSGFKHFIPLLKALRPKVSQQLWQTIEVTCNELNGGASLKLKNVFEKIVVLFK